MRTPVLVAEIGCNHMGDLDLARRFVDVADTFCEVNHVKFQKRSVRDLLSEEAYHAPHPEPRNSFGDSYGEHREYLEFDLDQHRRLKEHCDARGVVYSCSVWDVPSLREIASLEPEYLKIPSAVNINDELLRAACAEFGGGLHVSLGMTTRREEDTVVALLDAQGRLGDTVLYACTSGYPIQPADACLLEIPRLVESYAGDVAAIGYSGHHLGISLDVAAFTLGADWIERHFTLDRTWKGTDHAASLEPDGLRRVQRNLSQTADALSLKPREILDVELPQRDKLKWTDASVAT
jgi:N-acetylneuraminate synthase